MKKFILCIFLCILVCPTNAGFLLGAYRQFAYKCFKTQDMWRCESENWIEMNSAEDYCPKIKFGIAGEQDICPIIDFRISDLYAETSLGKVLNDITTLNNNQVYEKSCSFNLCFSDGEIFTCSGKLVDDRIKHYRGQDVGVAWIYANMNSMYSNKMNLNNFSDYSKITYISKKLSTKKIEKITFEGLNFTLTAVLTPQILCSFFTELYKKTSNKSLYHADN